MMINFWFIKKKIKKQRWGKKEEGLKKNQGLIETFHPQSVLKSKQQDQGFLTEIINIYRSFEMLLKGCFKTPV